MQEGAHREDAAPIDKSEKTIKGKVYEPQSPEEFPLSSPPKPKGVLCGLGLAVGVHETWEMCK